MQFCSTITGDKCGDCCHTELQFIFLKIKEVLMFSVSYGSDSLEE